jgi:hypothetical protein
MPFDDGVQRFLRHYNGRLGFDDDSAESGSEFFFDSQWIFRKISARKISRVPDFRQSRPTTVVRGILGERTEKVIGKIMEISSFLSQRHSRHDPAPIYELQGTAMGGGARAVDFANPRTAGRYPEWLRRKIEAAGTVRARGGVAKFATLPEGEAKEAIISLDDEIRKLVSKKKYIVNQDYELGFIELIHTPPGAEIARHKDGVNDCNFAANYALISSAQVSVEKKNFLLRPGDLYLFQPQEQEHAVGVPQDRVFGRYILSFRYFLN